MVIHACPFNFLMQSYHMTMLTIFKLWGVGSTPFPTQTTLDCFDEKTVSSHFLDLLKENGLLSFWWEFRLKEFLDKTGRGWSRDAVMNNF